MTSSSRAFPDPSDDEPPTAATHSQYGDVEALRLLVASVRDYAIFMLDPQGHIRTWNLGAERIKGYTASEVIGKHFSLFYTQEDVERGHPDWELQVAAETGRYEEEGWRCRKDRSRFWANVVITALRDERGDLRGFGKVTRDLTERKRAEDELRLANEQLEARVAERTAELTVANAALQQRERELTDFLENATIGLHWVGSDGTILWANRAELEMLDYSREEYIGHSITEFHADPPVIEDILQRLSSHETLHEYEARLRCKDGSVRYVLINSNVMWEGDEFHHTRCFTRDITERRKAEEALRAREAELRLVIDAVPALIAFVDTDGRYRFANRGYEDWFDLRRDEIHGKRQEEVLGAAVWQVWHRHAAAALRGEKVVFEGELRYRDGSLRWIGATYTPHRDERGNVQGFVALLQDLTERRAHLQTLQEQQEELGAANEELQVANEELADQQAELEAANEELIEHQQRLTQTAAALRESEAALRERTQTLETVNRIGQLLAAELDLSRLLQALTDAATEICEAQFGSFFYNSVNEQGEVYMLYTLSGVPREAFVKFPMPRNTAIFAPTFAGEATVRLDDVLQDPRYGQSAPYYGMPQGHLPVRSYLAVPVRSRSGEVLGGLFFGHGEMGIFTERHARLVEGVAAQAAVAIDNARLYQQAREAQAEQERRAREAALVADVGVALSEIAELPMMLLRVTEALVNRLDVAFVRIWTLNEEEQTLELRASSGQCPHLDGPHSRVPVGASEIGLIAAERKPYLTNEVATDPRVSDPEWAQREGLVAFAGYPLVIGDRLLGVLALFSRHLLAQDVLDALRAVADILAQGIERKRLEDEVRKRVEALAEADRRKDEFLAMLGHELRNPLSPALTALHVLKERPSDDPTAVRARDVAERQLRNMARIVDDLLDVSRITRGKIELRREPLELQAVLTRCADTLRPHLEAQQHELRCSCTDEPIYVYADLTRIDQVLANLLTNAAKYTEPGGTIWLSLEREGADAVIRVRDTGIGIPKELLPHLFELFVQNERSLDRAQGGLGIGLTLVRRLVEMHGGSVAAASGGPNQGSEFTIRLPALHHAPARNALDEPAAWVVPQRTYHLLVVDDNHDAAETLAELLTDLGHRVAVAHDGETAIEKAHEGPPDAVLLDIGLPRLNGYEVAQRLRGDERFRDTVLIALTGYGSVEDQRRSYAAGFNHHLTKPVDPVALLGVLASLPSRE